MTAAEEPDARCGGCGSRSLTGAYVCIPCAVAGQKCPQCGAEGDDIDVTDQTGEELCCTACGAEFGPECTDPDCPEHHERPEDDHPYLRPMETITVRGGLL